MSGRTYVVILFFWALLTIITPTLIRLSASAKLNSKFDDERMGRVRLVMPRRALVTEEPSPTSAPVPSPASSELAVSSEEGDDPRLRRYFFR